MKNFFKKSALKRFLCIPLIVMMLIAQMPVGVLAADAVISDDAEVSVSADETEDAAAVSADEAEAVSEDETAAAEEAAEEASDVAEEETNNIEINQGMSIHTGLNDGNETYMNTFVAKKATAVMMKIPGSDSMTEEQAKAAVANYKLEAKAVTNGQEADSCELTASGADQFSIKQTYTADCDLTAGYYASVKFPTGPDKGTYNFHWYNGDNEIAKFEGVTFYETKVLNILVVPVKGYWGAHYEGGAPSAGAFSCKDGKFKDPFGNEKDWSSLVSELKSYILDVYPVADVNITEANELEAGTADYDMCNGDGQKKLWEEACKLQSKDKDGKDRYDLILAFVQYRQDQGGGQGYTFGRPTNIITYSDVDMLPTVVHEIAHCYQVGDEYDGGSFNNAVNFPPNNYKGRDFSSGNDIAATSGANEYWKAPKEYKAATSSDKKDKIDENGAATMVSLSLHPYSLSQDKFITWGGVDAQGKATGDVVGPTITYMGSGYTGCDGYYWTSSVIWDHLLKEFTVKEKQTENSQPPAEEEEQQEEEQPEEPSNAEVFANALRSGVKLDENSIFTDESDFYFSDDYRFGDSRMVEVYGWIENVEGKPVFAVNPLFSYEGDLEYIDVLEGVYKDNSENYTFAALDSEGKIIKSPVDDNWAVAEFYGGFYNASNNKTMSEVNFNFDAEYPEGTVDFVIFKGKVAEDGSYSNVVWQASKDENFYAEFDDQPEGYLTYADVNSEYAEVEWEVFYGENKEEPYANEDGVLYTEVYYCPEGDDGEAYYVGCSLDEDWEEGYISFETDSQFATKWTRNAYVWVKVTNGVNAVDIYSDANEVTLCNSKIELKGKGIAKKGTGDDVTYTAECTGAAITPDTVVEAYNPFTGKYIKLKKDVDYTVSYEDNTDVGFARVIVQGIGTYAGKNTQEFEIVAKNLDGTAASIPDIVYTEDLDSAVLPYLQMKDKNGKQLTYLKDFYVTFTADGKTKQSLKKVVSADPAEEVPVEVEYIGLNNYKDASKKTVSFYVLPSSSESAALGSVSINIVLKNDTVQYSGKAVEAKIKSVSYTNEKGEEIKLGKKDYSVVYSNNVEVGTARVTVVGKNGYTGSASRTFTIAPKEVKSLKVSKIKTQPYTGSELDINDLPIVVKAGNIVLTKGVDYTVEKSEGVDYAGIGKASVTIRLIEDKGQKNTPKAVWSAKAKKTEVIAKFTIAKTKLNSNAVVLQVSSNNVSQNVVKAADGTEIGIIRSASRSEMAEGKNKYSFVIEGSADALAKGADLSAAVVLKAYGRNVDAKDYTIAVGKAKDGKIGSITIKPVKGNKLYSGKKVVKFLYVKQAEAPKE